MPPAVTGTFSQKEIPIKESAGGVVVKK